jgi:hypothetical protein
VRPQCAPWAVILSQVSVSVATCQYVQSSMVSGAAGLGGSTRYAAPRSGSTARPRVNEGSMVSASVFEFLRWKLSTRYELVRMESI